VGLLEMAKDQTMKRRQLGPTSGAPDRLHTAQHFMYFFVTRLQTMFAPEVTNDTPFQSGQMRSAPGAPGLTQRPPRLHASEHYGTFLVNWSLTVSGHGRTIRRMQFARHVRQTLRTDCDTLLRLRLHSGCRFRPNDMRSGAAETKALRVHRGAANRRRLERLS
jgi:hypothetical protein